MTFRIARSSFANWTCPTWKWTPQTCQQYFLALYTARAQLYNTPGRAPLPRSGAWHGDVWPHRIRAIVRAILHVAHRLWIQLLRNSLDREEERRSRGSVAHLLFSAGDQDDVHDCRSAHPCYSCEPCATLSSKQRALLRCVCCGNWKRSIPALVLSGDRADEIYIRCYRHFSPARSSSTI